MNIGKIQDKVISSKTLVAGCTPPKKFGYSLNQASYDSVSFTGASTQLAKKGIFALRRLANAMKDITEYHNAIIAAIGTGIIAPLIILASPGKGDKEDKDKKFFQAIRQPLSAVLALAFQVPATMLVNKGIDKLTYGEKPLNLFKDKVLGTLIPEKSYLRKQITKEQLAEWENKFEDVVNGKSLREELEGKIRQEYQEVGLTVPDKKLKKRIKKDKLDFLKDKIADKMNKEALERKVDELMGKNIVIDDLELVSEDYKRLAQERFKDAYNALEKDAKLTKFDKFMRIMGFDTKNLKKLKDSQDTFLKDKGLELFKEDNKEIFTDSRAKLKKYIEAYKKKSLKTLSGKRFWISLGVNLFMVTASCYALNWAHPRVKELIDLFRDKKADKNANVEKKDEVKSC